MSTISDGTTSAPVLHVATFETTRTSGNVVRRPLGSPDVDVSGRPASLRRGTIPLYFATAADSYAAEEMHRAAGVVIALSGEDDTVDMSYVVDGQIVRGPAPEDPDMWVLRVDFQEVLP